MRIVLDYDNYFVAGSLAEYVECEYGTCQEYTGAIPSGFSSYEDWFVNCDCRNAYKLVNGNLVLDTDRKAELETKINQETIDNTPLLHKDLYGTNEVLDSQYQKATASGKLLTLGNVKNIAPTVILTDINCYAYNKINLIATGNNLLPNEGTTRTIDGVYFIKNTDGSIYMNGTATADIEYNIAGTSINTSPFLVFKKGFNYHLSCGYTLKMYSYDGTDRTQVYSGTGGLINFVDEDKKITQVVLSIPSGTTINNVAIYPMLNLGIIAEPYEKAKINTLEIDFSSLVDEALFPRDDLYPSDDLYPKGTIIDYIFIANGTVYIFKNNTLIPCNVGNLQLFNGNNIVCASEDINIEMEYSINVLEVEDLGFMQGKSTKTNKFRVLADGSIEAHDGYFSGNIYLNDGSKVIGGDGLITNLQYVSSGEYLSYKMLGFNTGYINGVYSIMYEDVPVDIYIPENFIIQSAKLVLEHTPVFWEGYDSSTNTNYANHGYSRNIKLYKGSQNYNFYLAYGGGYRATIEASSLIEIPNAFGGSTYTPSNTSGNTVTIKESIDIKNYLTTGQQKLLLRTSDGIPANVTNASQKTGMARATLNIIGYLRILK